MAIDRSKDGVARRLAESHFDVEPGISRILRLVRTDGDENLPQEPVKLLEVNDNTTAVGIRPVFFGADNAAGVFFPSAIIEVTPEEYERIQTGQLRLPHGWTIGEEYRRTAHGTVS